MRFDFLIPVVYNDQDIRFNTGLGRELTQAGARVAFLTHTEYGTRALREAGNEDVFFLYEGFDPARVPSDEEIRTLERRYDLGSMADFVYPEQMVTGAEPQDRLIRRAVHDFGFLERLCARHEVRFFLNNLGPELARRCSFRLRDKGGPENIVQDFAPIHGRIALTTQEVAWDELPEQLPQLDAAQKAAMVAYRAGALQQRKSFTKPQALKVGPQNVLNALKYAQRSLSERVDYSVPALVYQRLESVVRVQASRVLYERPVPGERYYFFPLHLADDSAITIRAPQFQRQEELLRYMAERVLPMNAKLYVKPHPGAMHAYSLDTLRKIAALPNVRLIDPRVSSHDLIGPAEAVIVINSTVGFESMLYGKPLVTLGRVFYRGWGVTTDVDQLAELPRAVARAVAAPVDMDRVDAFLHACHEATYDAHLSAQTPENFQRVATALLAKAEKLAKTGGRGANPERFKVRFTRPATSHGAA